MAEIDKRSKQDILNALKERSASYTPEWRFSTENPDIGAVLAMAYADMFSGTLKKLNGTILKNKIAFYNTANASLLPAEPSEGYVTFTLASGDAADTGVQPGTVLSAPSDSEDTVYFETSDDILVSQAKIDRIFCTDDKADYIGEYEGFRDAGVLLFDKTPDNLQKHTMTISHPYVFEIAGDSVVRIRFLRRGGIPVQASVIASLADPDRAFAAYYAGEALGYVPFAGTAEENGDLVLSLAEYAPVPVPDDSGSFSIRITAEDIAAFADFAFMRVTAASEGGMVECDTVTDGNMEYRKELFYPFGERFGLYNEVYFGVHEVLCKRGAEVTLSFDVEFQNIPMENPMAENEIQYKWIADRKDFIEDREYEIAITEVIWEYYNGYGWRRLFEGDEYSDLFSMRQGSAEAYRTMRFVCPEDIMPVFVGAGENYFIRARVLKADNLYKLRAHYLSPLVRNLAFAYSYTGEGRTITSITCGNNMGNTVYDPAGLPEEKGFVPFFGTDAPGAAVYLGFTYPPKNGPYRILWDIRENPASREPRLLWEYYADGKWRPVNMVDETVSFTKPGSTIFLDNHDMTPVTLFGNTLCYIRISDPDDAYRSGTAFLPIVENIYENTVRAVNIDSREEDLFIMNVYRENAEFTLARESVLDLEVFVNETDTITAEELDRLEAEDRIQREYDETGLVSTVWVKWMETAAFAAASAQSRVYTIDRSRGILTFGNGRQGKIPMVSESENIRVVYTTGGGKRSNVDVGQIQNLERSVGFITGVTNPKRFYGGYDTELLADAMRRTAAMIRTQGKAVTARDYEELARAASRNVRGVQCCPGYNLYGERENGAVTLVVIREPDAAFSNVRTELLEYLTPRIQGGTAMTGKLYVTEPEYVRMHIRASIAVRNVNDVRSVKKAVEDKLRTLLDVTESSYIGSLPTEQQIRSCIMSAGKIVRLSSIYISTYIAGAEGYTEIDAEKLSRRKYILPENGIHDISVTLA